MEYSYIIVKPDGLKLFGKLKKYLSERNIDIVGIYKLENFDNVSIKLYLDLAATFRGNAPIIIGINKVWREKYGTTALLLLLSPMIDDGVKDFAEKVCELKKSFRKKNIPDAYIPVTVDITEDDYKKYDIVFSEELAKKRAVKCGSYNQYVLQLNAIHSPDDKKILKKEIQILRSEGGFNTRISLAEAIQYCK